MLLKHQSQRTFENQVLIIEVKKYVAYWGESKQSEVVAGKFDLFHNVNSGWVLGGGSAATGKFCNLYTHLFLETVFPAIRLTQNFYLQCNMNIFS